MEFILSPLAETSRRNPQLLVGPPDTYLRETEPPLRPTSLLYIQLDAYLS